MIANTYDRVLTSHMQSFDLTSSQAHILGFLSRNGGIAVNQRSIEEEFGLKHPTVTGLLSRLKDKDYVSFSTDENDKRRKRISLTQKSMHILSNARSLINETDDELFGGLPPEEQKELSAILDKVIANIRSKHTFSKEELYK